MIRRRSFLLYGVSATAVAIADAAFGAAGERRAGGGGAKRGGKRAAADAGDVAADTGGPVDTSNTLRLSGGSGAGASNQPLRIGRPFVQGEIASAPQAVIGGAKLPTQADVKTRWPDGSVKHAVLSFVVPQVPLGGAKVTFVNQANGAGDGLTREEMLDRAYDFEAVIAITENGKTQTASARTMLMNGDYTVWCKGPIATTVILADHSPARKYDMGVESIRPLRPIFHATFWPGLKKVQVRAIGEIANTEALQDIIYALDVRAGLAAPKSVFHQDDIAHYAATRWTRQFWIGGEPPPIGLDHNIAYLSRTYFFPAFDPALDIPEAVIAQAYKKWQGAKRNLYDDGLWQKAMNAAGGRDDIGPYTAWQAKWLLSGDQRLFEIVNGQADLAGAWAMNVREGDPAKRFDAEKKISAMGRPLSVYARPSLWLFDERGNTTAADQVTIAGQRVIRERLGRPWGGWRDDGAHQPDPFSALYTLSGDYYALEQLQLWAGSQVLRYNPGYKGPAPSGGFYDEVRGDAWVLRNRVHAAFLSPDGTPEKVYFTKMVDDAVSFFEGMHGVRGTKFENSPIYDYAKERRTNVSPYLHIFRVNERSQEQDAGGLKGDSFQSAGAMWESYFVIFELGVAKEKGFPTGPLLTWTGQMLTSQFTEPGYSPYNVQRFHTAFSDGKGTWYRTWTETLASDTDPSPPMPFKNDVCDGYAAYAYGASTMLVNEPGGRKAYEWLRDNAYLPRRGRYAHCPKWAYVARA